MKTNGTRIVLLLILLIVATADYILLQDEKTLNAPSTSSVVSGSNHLFVSFLSK